MAKKFMFACAGILMLSMAFALGAQSVHAQLGGDFVGITLGTQGNLYAITNSGDVYRGNENGAYWQFIDNVRTGPVSTESESLGDVKSTYR